MIPKEIPLTVAMIITKNIYTKVFFVPMTLRITSMLGKLSAGPANNNANAGPLPIPAPIRPCRIGTSVRVAKYINAPKIDAKKFANNELPPTNLPTNLDGIMPSCPTLPRRKPATKTPSNKSGSI